MINEIKLTVEMADKAALEPQQTLTVDIAGELATLVITPSLVQVTKNGQHHYFTPEAFSTYRVRILSHSEVESRERNKLWNIKNKTRIHYTPLRG
jgi:hypothetical protein